MAWHGMAQIFRSVCQAYLIGRLQAWRPALRKEQREQLSARARRSIDVGGANRGAVPGPGNGAKGAAADSSRPVYPSPFSLYSSPLAALDTTAEDTEAPGAEHYVLQWSHCG